jgi:uncharacterized membrane protein YsdA (DUF1294 family)
MSRVDQFAIGWFALWSAVAFFAFGLDKRRARRGAERVSEFTLVALAALGGWPGGLLGMIRFRHKTAKWTFRLKFALALIPFAAEVWTWWRFR